MPWSDHALYALSYSLLSSTGYASRDTNDAHLDQLTENANRAFNPRRFMSNIDSEL